MGVLEFYRESYTACTRDRWEDSRHDFYGRRCPSSGRAAKRGSEAAERVHQGRLLLESDR